jgi:large subunit ribosomal protein L22
MKRIRPAPMGRAFRYQRRMAHLEIALAERNRGAGNGDALATTVTEAAPAARKPAAKKKLPAKKKTVAKKKVAAKKTSKAKK